MAVKKIKYTKKEIAKMEAALFRTWLEVRKYKDMIKHQK
jgi:hypothetical protein